MGIVDNEYSNTRQ